VVAGGAAICAARIAARTIGGALGSARRAAMRLYRRSAEVLRRAMLRSLVRQMISLVLSLLFASAVIFRVVALVPGDPASFMLGTGAQPETLAALRRELGLDQPLPLRYLAWLGGVIQGDFGHSFTYRTPVSGMIVERLQLSLPL